MKDATLAVPGFKEEMVSRLTLEHYWDEVLEESGPITTIGLPVTSAFGNSPSLCSSSLMVFLPLYLGATFLKCRQCGACCKPNSREWDKGIIITAAEARVLSDFTNVSHYRNSLIIKYPCSLLDSKIGCQQYSMRPLACRLFPLSIQWDERTRTYRHGIIMACPAAKELYIQVQLYLQELNRWVTEKRDRGEPRFSLSDFQNLALLFSTNQISEENNAYLRKIAKSPMNC